MSDQTLPDPSLPDPSLLDPSLLDPGPSRLDGVEEEYRGPLDEPSQFPEISEQRLANLACCLDQLTAQLLEVTADEGLEPSRIKELQAQTRMLGAITRNYRELDQMYTDLADRRAKRRHRIRGEEFTAAKEKAYALMNAGRTDRTSENDPAAWEDQTPAYHDTMPEAYEKKSAVELVAINAKPDLKNLLRYGAAVLVHEADATAPPAPAVRAR